MLGEITVATDVKGVGDLAHKFLKGAVTNESPIKPKEELVEINLQNDTLKVDGNFVVAWSSSLQFTTERSTKTLIGSAVSGEGLVNVFRGTGKLWMMPVTVTSTEDRAAAFAAHVTNN